VLRELLARLTAGGRHLAVPEGLALVLSAEHDPDIRRTGVWSGALIHKPGGFMSRDPDDRSFGEKLKDTFAGGRERGGEERYDMERRDPIKEDVTAPEREMRAQDAGESDDAHEAVESTSDVTERTIHERSEHTSENR
jgi:hypothetical protein